MCCEHLVCANCSGPVPEGRCAVCRRAREQFGHESHSHLSPTLLGLMLVLAAVVLLLLQQH
jgi:hypothetical protein